MQSLEVYDSLRTRENVRTEDDREQSLERQLLLVFASSTSRCSYYLCLIIPRDDTTKKIHPDSMPTHEPTNEESTRVTLTHSLNSEEP